MKIAVLRNVTPRSLVDRYQSFKELYWLHLYSRRGRQYIIPKRWSLSTKLHDVMPQKSAMLIITAVRTPNLSSKLFREHFFNCLCGRIPWQPLLSCMLYVLEEKKLADLWNPLGPGVWCQKRTMHACNRVFRTWRWASFLR
jgi:hypothetical protein